MSIFFPPVLTLLDVLSFFYKTQNLLQFFNDFFWKKYYRTISKDLSKVRIAGTKMQLTAKQSFDQPVADSVTKLRKH